MSLTSKKTAALDKSSAVKATRKAARQARKAGKAAAANGTSAAQSAALAAQNAAGVAQVTAQNAAVLAANAAHNASDAAQMAASGVSKGVRQGVYSARSWAAPRLDSAADYCTTTVAPKVSDALRSTARQVRPPAKASKRSSILTWSMLGAAILAALGAAAVAARYRYRAAIAADSETADEEEVLGDSIGSQPAPVTPDGTGPDAATSKDPGAETSVNGRVTTTQW
jgi:trimeric autotransporter adhesin